MIVLQFVFNSSFNSLRIIFTEGEIIKIIIIIIIIIIIRIFVWHTIQVFLLKVKCRETLKGKERKSIYIVPLYSV